MARFLVTIYVLLFWSVVSLPLHELGHALGAALAGHPEGWVTYDLATWAMAHHLPGGATLSAGQEAVWRISGGLFAGLVLGLAWGYSRSNRGRWHASSGAVLGILALVQLSSGVGEVMPWGWGRHLSLAGMALGLAMFLPGLVRWICEPAGAGAEQAEGRGTMPFVVMPGGRLPKNKGKAWIAHGNNVITFPVAHSNASYRWAATLVHSAMGGITPVGTPHTRPLTVFLLNESASRGKVRIEGGYGFTSCGYTTNYSGLTERYDDVANTHTARANATARADAVGYSLNGYGFTSCGDDASDNRGTTERYDDVANTHTARATATARTLLAGYSLNGYGITSCGWTTGRVGTTQRYDDVANTHTGRANATARNDLAGYSLNGYGFTSCGSTGASTGLTERFDDAANTHSGRASATARFYLAGYALAGYGFTSCGYTTSAVGTTERYDDMANTHTSRADATARRYPTGYSLNGYGFTVGGYTTALVGTAERYDDVANTHSGRTAATAKRDAAGYATNEYFINYLTMEA